MSEFERYIRELLEAALQERLDAEPWWCSICGESGNGYDPARHQEANWFGPSDHECDFGSLPIVDLTGIAQ